MEKLNIRLSYGRDPETNEVAILKESHYYPFGLEHQGYVSNHKMFEAIPIGEPRASLLPVRNYLDDSYRYTFGGKEAQPELGLNWLDFHARNYDAALGRWMNVDPLAEEFVSLSPKLSLDIMTVQSIRYNTEKRSLWQVSSKNKSLFNPEGMTIV